MMEQPKLEEIYDTSVKKEDIELSQSKSQKNGVYQKNQYQQQGQWTEEENLKVIFFLEYFKDIFSYRNRRRFCHIFTWLSRAMGNKTSRQCRCRHQKMMQRFKNFNGAKKHFIKKMGEGLFNARYVLMVEEFQNIAEDIKETGLELNIVEKNNAIKNQIMFKEGIKIQENGEGPVIQ